MRRNVFILTVLGGWIGTLLLASPSFAATYYVRVDGGTSTQCTGLKDAAYPGSGTGQACAFNHPQWALAPIGNNPSKLAGGDTLIVDGSSGAQYMIGYQAPNTNDLDKCDKFYPWDCRMRAIPSGPDAAHPTRILGKGWDTGCAARPQFWANELLPQVLDLTGSNNVEIQCLEVTDHSACTFYGGQPTTACKRGGGNYPYGAQADYGLYAQDSSNVLLKNVNIHGFGIGGVHAGRLKDWTLENVDIIANSFVGWDGDIGANNSYDSGSMTFTNVKIQYNGCGETYPGKQPYNCISQGQGGYGDGIGTHVTGGNWVFNNSDISFNTSDGLDLLYHDFTGSIVIKRSRFEGNAGNQVKGGASTVSLENSIAVGNCDYFQNNPITWNSSTFMHCRAYGNTAAFTLGVGNQVSILNSTLTSRGDVLIETGGDSCNGTEKVKVSNSIFLGNQKWYNGDKVSYYYGTGATGNGDGPCGPILHQTDHSIVFNVKDNYCPPGTGNICSDPKFVGPLSGNDWGIGLQSASPARDKAAQLVGVSSLDFNNFDRGTPWDMGALEYGSVSSVNPNPVPTNSGVVQCGNGLVEAGEQCDDGNLLSGDGCSDVCVTEVIPSTSTTPPPSTPASTTQVCGNGIQEGSEACDDGNPWYNDGCDPMCRLDANTPPKCGNGDIELGEECDDDNLNNGDGCSSLCKKETASTASTTPVCGNGIQEGSEACDDGNPWYNDGCDPMCRLDANTPPNCGNGDIELGEECDDDNLNNGDGCSSTCKKESLTTALPPACVATTCSAAQPACGQTTTGTDNCGSSCSKVGTACPVPVCGNRVVESPETCDDGNTVSGDGCNSSCQKEQSTAPVCGNGKVEGTEQCDDGNTVSGDGCSSTCRVSSIFNQPVCGNGKLEGNEQCDDGNRVSGDGCSRYCQKERIIRRR